jgi:hypothetical protein
MAKCLLIAEKRSFEMSWPDAFHDIKRNMQSKKGYAVGKPGRKR